MSDPTESRFALELRDVSKAFDGKRVLRGLSLRLRWDEILSVLGASGAGKTVLLKLVVGLERPDSGQIFFDGRDISALPERQLYRLRQQIGYVFQDGALFDSLTVEENLEYPLRLHTDWSERRIATVVRERLEALDMAGTEKLHPDELSGGMKKRVGMGRATILAPKLVLFDEPTAGLDPVSVARFARTIQKFRHTRGTTAVVVTHDTACAFAISDRIAFLRDGRIHAIGTPDEIRESQDPSLREFFFPSYRWQPEEA